MLLKYTHAEKRSKINGNSRQQRSTGNMKLLAATNALNTRLPRKTVKGFATKRPSSHLRPLPVAGREDHRSPLDASDNSNDSGLGFDQHLDVTGAVQAVLRLSEREIWDNEHSEAKRKKLEIKLETDDANDNFCFSHAMSKSHKATSQPGGLVPECLMPSRGGAGASGMQRPLGGTTGNGGGGGSGGAGGAPRGSLTRLPSRPVTVPSRRPPGPVSLSSPLMGQSRDGRVQLQIASQPEQQHRARYQTEGSRGAVKDRSGNGFPVVKLVGYNKPATLQVFIGTDMGRVAPHMFYQACKVSGKNSTPCVEKKVDGTIVIEVDFDPVKDMIITCDCVGILKERNVDVEHRFPDQSGTRNKKKSTRCRMIFRTTITHPDGSLEILQTTSQPIVCTQPPGVPEICKKSLSVACCTGGMELFILGKNFLKDTRVVFQQTDIEPAWEETVQPDKEFLQQTHLVCIVPAYQRSDILEPVTVRLLVTSSGKTSEPHSFTYMPATNPVLQPAVGSSDIPQSCLNLVSSGVSHGCVDLNRAFNKPHLGPPSGLILPGTPTKPPAAVLPGLPHQLLSADPARVKKDIHPVRVWASMPLVGDPSKTEDMKARDNEQSKVLGLKMMHPLPLLPISRGSLSNVVIIPDAVPVLPSALKTEVVDDSSQESAQLSPEELKGIDLRMKPATSVGPIATVSDLLSTQSPSLATFRRFVSNPSDAPLPTQSGQSVEKYLSHIENPIGTKVGDTGGGGGGGGGTAVAIGVTVTAASVSTSAIPAANSSGSAAQELARNKICATEAPINTQFSAPIMFGPSPASNNSLLTPSLPSSVSETQKVPFGNDLTLPPAYSSASSVVEKEQRKPQLIDQVTLQDTMASRLLSVGLNSVVAASQTKPKYQENSLPGLCSAPPHASTLLPPVTNTALSDFSAAAASSTEPSPLTVPTLLSTIADSSTIMGTSNSLLYNNSQLQPSKHLLTSPEVPQKADEQLINISSKISNCSSSSSSPSSSSSVGVLGTSHNLLSSSATSPDNVALNISTQSGTIGGNLLAVTQAESALMTGTSDTRLDALVSSAIESRILEANSQTTEKLGVFSSGSIMNAVSAENVVLGAAPTQVPLSDNLATNQNTTSPIHVQDMTLNPALTVPSVNTFPLNALSSQPSAQITQENLILNNTVTAAFNTHLLSTGSSPKVADSSLTLNSVREPALTMEPVATVGTPHIVLSNPPCAPPIAMKNIIMSSVNTTGDTNMLSSSASQSSQISGKNIVSSSVIGSSNDCIPNSGHTSPVSVKTMMLTATVDESSVMTTAMDMKNILAPASVKEDMALSAATTHCSPPIALKKIILESGVGNVLPDPTLEVKSMLNGPHADSLLAASVPHVSLSTDKLDALVESTMNKHILTSPMQPSPTTSSMNIDGSVCASANSLPISTQSLATILVSNMPPSLSNSTSLTGPSSALLSESETRELHTSTAASSLENANVALTSPRTLQGGSPGILPSQSQSVTQPPLMSMFSNENGTSAKTQTLESVPAVSTTCSPILDHHLTMFGQQPSVSVHTLLSSNQSSTDAQTLRHPIPFPSTNSNTSGLITSAPCALEPKMADVTPAEEGQAQARLLNEALMALATGDSRKNQMDVIVTQDSTVNKDIETPKYVVTSVECKIAVSSSVEACSSSVAKLDVQAIHLQQQEKLQMQQQNISDQVKQGEKPQMVSSASLPVPVTDISPARQITKGSVTVVQGPTQKKLEEGMVPQELTQMSESDLLSYINPSCFDQV